MKKRMRKTGNFASMCIAILAVCALSAFDAAAQQPSVATPATSAATPATPAAGSPATAAQPTVPAGQAQNTAPETGAEGGALTLAEQLEAEREAEEEADKNAPFQDSFLFTAQARTNINRAVRGICVRMGEEGGPAQRRVLKLAGLLYQAPGQWIIWLNGKRVTPDRLLPEIVDIDVNMSSVYLEWFDIGLNKVISITLRPHQVYDIETGILLPG